MADYVSIAFLPDPGVQPRASEFAPDTGAPGDRIPAIYLARNAGSEINLTLQFNPNDLGEAVRYLRQLAAVATDLADQVADHAAKAVLTP